MKKRKFNGTVLLAVLLVIVSVYAIGSTIAWLKDQTSTIKNTFTTAKVDIDLTEPIGEENDYEFIMSPGAAIDKDPKITVKTNSVDSYIFIKITESSNFDDYLSYELAEGWFALDGVENVYYRSYTSSESDVVYPILKNDQVLVTEDVTYEELYDLYGNYPTLSFTAYAVQMEDGKDKFTVLEAWEIADEMSSDNDMSHSGGSSD